MRVVDIDDPNVVLGPGERGELMFRGPLVMDGYFTIVDLKTDMILTAGYNVYPAELERVSCVHSAVSLAAVTGVPDEAKGELAKAYVVLKPGSTATADSLIAHCREHLAAYKVPRSIQFVDSVPITASGKIMRRLLKDVDEAAQ